MTPSEAYVRVVSPSSSEGWPSLPSRRAAEEAAPSLREQAIKADAAAQIDINLALFWRESMGGLCTVVDDFFTDERCYLVLSPTLGRPERPIVGRRREILEAVLCGEGQKNIAMDKGLAPSTVALNARLALESLGLTCKPSRVHPLLMLAARASRDPHSTLSATLSFVQRGAEQLRVVAMARPDRRLAKGVPPAERAVVRALIEGQSYADIAVTRGTSTRTIANQITAVFRRMQVSGRSELLERLFVAEGTGRGPSTRALQQTLAPPMVNALPSRPRRTA
jgi:DNA-binding NarL/FixJ family response regulator